MEEKRLASGRKMNRNKINRSTTHIRVKKTIKFQLERFMRKHHLKTHSEAIRKLLENAAAS